ncbi:MAG: hypothetical protein ABI885_12430 [Gammaproteobacteria bacterium]
MTLAASTPRHGVLFDDFLFAPLGQDRNGLPLSVLSALARLDRDPWEEAATLARLPADAAALQLASLLRALPAESLVETDRGATATRLIALLPRRASSGVRDPAPVGAVPPAHSGPGANVIFFAIYIIVLLVSQFITARHQSPTSGDVAHAPTSVAAPPQTLPPRPMP